MPGKIWATPAEIAAIFSIPVKTLAQMRWEKKGPKYYKLGRILYKISEVEEWVNYHSRKTSDSIEMERMT